MTQVADLELSIHRQEQNIYIVDFRYNDGDAASQADVRLGARDQAYVSFDFNRLVELRMTGDMRAYGQVLTEAFFGAECLRAAFSQARATSQSSGTALRIRLAVAADAQELHPLGWELLCDPQSCGPLATDQTVYFSRYLSSQDWRPVRLRSKGELKALAVIAAPDGLDAYQLAPVDRMAEAASIAGALGEIRLNVLERGTLNRLFAAMSAGEMDILYLVAHGTFTRGEPYLWLEDDAGGVARVSGAELVNRLRQLEYRPRLVVLASCQAAGRGTGDILSSLGPRLVEIGIPAVLAMQDDLRMDTSARFMPLFFSELQKDGQIDRAVCVARGLVQDQPDWWVPSLFMRLKSGRLWYTPGFADARKGFEKFPAQIQNIKSRHLTPILGPGLVEGLLDSPQQIARSWAETFRYPMAPHERESLPQVAQYLAINQQKSFPYEDLISHLRARMQERFRGQLPEELLREDAPCWQVLDAAGKLQRANNPDEPHRALAELPVEIYLSANADTLLEGALIEAGKKPQTRICPWNDYTAEQESEREDDTNSVDRPLVYHLFGLWKDRASLVLTEDNYFDFLLGMARNKALIPLQVKKAMTDSGLLFLGFQTNEWQFRVLFRAMLSLPGQRYDEYANIAAQIEPEDGRILDPKRAREYLEQYFFKGCKLDLSIYWGMPQDFIKELMQYWRRQL
jgi:hypothetical protein